MRPEFLTLFWIYNFIDFIVFFLDLILYQWVLGGRCIHCIHCLPVILCSYYFYTGVWWWRGSDQHTAKLWGVRLRLKDTNERHKQGEWKKTLLILLSSIQCTWPDEILSTCIQKQLCIYLWYCWLQWNPYVILNLYDFFFLNEDWSFQRCKDAIKV